LRIRKVLECANPLALSVLLLFAAPLEAATKKNSKPQTPAPVPPGKPELFQIDPRGVQRGATIKIKLSGTNLIGLTELKLSNPKLTGNLLAGATTNEAWVELTVSNSLARGPYELSVRNTNAESSKLKFFVDDLPQVFLTMTNRSTPQKVPASFWGTLERAGQNDEIAFQAKKGESLVLDLAAKSIGSKANVLLTVFDQNGRLIGADTGFDGGDPLLGFTAQSTGLYHARVTEKTEAGSKEHFYRLSVGSFALVTACFPISVPTNHESEVRLIGFNLPAQASVRVKAGGAGEMELPLDKEKFRMRRSLKVLVDPLPQFTETEPNDTPGQAMPISVPAAVNGRIWRSPGASADVDMYAFEALEGKVLVIETDAARRGSPVDTKIEVLDAEGSPVERLLLQAVRDSHLTFKPIDSVTDDLRVENWQEMDLNEYMYLKGEVCKIFRMPQGPDSGFQLYNIGGKRHNYFDSSALSHALDEDVYIVEPRPPGSKLPSNGLPAFPLYYANDDDGERKLGVDSRLLFTAPKSGKYVVQVSDSRGYGGERFAYRLVVREAKPDFTATLTGVNPTINAGSGREFSVSADRKDSFEGEIKVDISGLPPGFTASTPLVIQSGHLEVKGTLNAALDAPKPSEINSATKVLVTASIAGRTVTREINNFGKIILADKPKLFVALEPYEETATNFVEGVAGTPPLEITIAPGQTVPAWLKIKRNGHDELVSFSVEGLPHGVIVDNIGLNGVLIPKGENARQIFLSAAKWVPEVDRFCFAKAAQADNQTSLPVLLHVRKLQTQAQSK